jgi:thioredoxin 1
MMSNFVTLTKDNFKKTIEENEFVIVDFWAPWCDPCVEFTPTFEAAAKKNKDIIFGMVDIEKDKEIAEYFQIKVIPGLLVIRERAGIFAHDDGEFSDKAFDEIITWAREYDMSTVKDYYKREGSGQIN